ncbi:cAMP-dependent protein kinase catalytic subunit [Drosophila grimshawi]|uniref:GH21410 n=1 Tax=Drosophila grimshawi TaxID=7222 RepID=B4J937_DROGR|nr:cAMP-dependent protein kinase catalytic subunit [Drosophila grimshawi]EDW01386.1 GH21410 [Drosophila grimshawi]
MKLLFVVLLCVAVASAQLGGLGIFGNAANRVQEGANPILSSVPIFGDFLKQSTQAFTGLLGGGMQQQQQQQPQQQQPQQQQPQQQQPQQNQQMG